MDAERRQAVPNDGKGKVIPPTGKRPLRDVRQITRTRYWLRAIGVGLFVACPWIFYLLMSLLEDSWAFIPALIAAPIAIFLGAGLLYLRGDSK